VQLDEQVAELVLGAALAAAAAAGAGKQPQERLVHAAPAARGPRRGGGRGGGGARGLGTGEGVVDVRGEARAQGVQVRANLIRHFPLQLLRRGAGAVGGRVSGAGAEG
jgi:hypothetical protein